MLDEKQSLVSIPEAFEAMSASNPIALLRSDYSHSLRRRSHPPCEQKRRSSRNIFAGIWAQSLSRPESSHSEIAQSVRNNDTNHSDPSLFLRSHLHGSWPKVICRDLSLHSSL